MSKKSDKRRQKRRQQHQVSQASRSRELRRRVDDQAARTAATMEEVVGALKDENQAPAAVAAKVADAAAGDRLLLRVLSTDETATVIAEEVAEASGKQRALAVAGALEDKLDDHVWLGRLAVSLAEEADDLEAADRIAERCLAALDTPADTAIGAQADTAIGAQADTATAGDAPLMASELALIRRHRGLLGDALKDLEAWCTRWPDEVELQATRARLIAHATALESGDPKLIDFFPYPVAEGQEAVAAGAVRRFADRTLLYRLRDAVESFIAADPELAARRDAYIAEFMGEVREAAGAGEFDTIDPEMAALAAEKFWLDADDEGEAASKDDTAVLELFADDPRTPPELAGAAQAWLDHACYGLWLGDWEAGCDGAGGLWVTDIVTRRTLFVSIPPEQVQGVPRWTVLAGAVAPVAGVWRTGQSLLAMDPTLGDEAAEAVLFVADRLFIELAREAGLKPGRPAPDRRRRPRPHGVLSDVAEPMDPAEADLTAKVIAGSLTELVGMAEARRHRAPAMRNMDGEPIELISAGFPVDDTSRLRKVLLADPDFEGDDDGPLQWMGRYMTPDEAKGAVSQFKAHARQEGWGDVDAPEGPQRWLRGSLDFEDGSVRVEVNSRARLDTLSAKLRKLGAGEPTLRRRIDPAMDFPGGGPLRLGRSLGAEADAAWMEQWVTEAVPALDGATPTAAATHPRRVVLLEALLRQFEHDADVVAAGGGTPMDFAALRDRLGMRDGVLDRDVDEG